MRVKIENVYLVNYKTEGSGLNKKSCFKKDKFRRSYNYA